MQKFINWIITGDWCTHKWKVIKTISLFDGPNDSMPASTQYVLQCEYCGNIKTKGT